MSLKEKLNKIIKDRKGGMLSINEIDAYCKEWKYKLSNAERRLRPSESPGIVPIKKNGAIIGYRYAGEVSPVESVKQDICSSCRHFMTHAKDCPAVKKDEVRDIIKTLW